VEAVVGAESAVQVAAAETAAEALESLSSLDRGLTSQDASHRGVAVGPNALRAHRARWGAVLVRQFKSPILILLFATAVVSMFVGEGANAAIIAVILIVSIALGFANEYRAERAADALHDRIRHTVVCLRDGAPMEVDVTAQVPGDVVRVGLGSVVPADLRILSCHDLTCDEAILTGESLPVAKSADPVPKGAGLGELSSCLLMGTVVQSGAAVALVVETGARTEFGRVAVGLAGPEPQTEFQRGLGRFSALLLVVAISLTTLIFAANVLLQRPIIDSLLFSLAIAVGITPQLLPTVVSASLAVGSRALAKQKVLVKRLVCIEDLGDIDLLVTDKTGTLTEGRISFDAALPIAGRATEDELVLLGLLATEVDYAMNPVSTVGLNAIDAALWKSAEISGHRPTGYRQVEVLPFDHERRMTSVLVDDPTARRMIVTKGSPEDVMRVCGNADAAAQAILDGEYARGARVVAVARRPATEQTGLTAADEAELELMGFLTFVDPPKLDARASLERLAQLGISVKIATGDSAIVAERVLADVGITSGGTLVGSDLDALGDADLRAAAVAATVFARVSPEQKARLVRVLRDAGRSVAFLGDGVNDALALHQADIGISVESAADVAKDAADVLLLDKDLSVLADGVVEGRRIFANTIKYVLMGTSSNFGNMFSASVASVVLNFLPMLPGQILLNNLLYDAGQLAIPGDRVDKEQLLAPSHWNLGYIRRFMFLFGPASSLFDFATFALMLGAFHASAGEFRSGWFIESIATQTLIIFAIRTRRVPFLRSRPALGVVVAALAVVAIGAWVPFSPIAGVLGFVPLPFPFFLALVAIVIAYLVLVELVKTWFFSRPAQRVRPMTGARGRGYPHRVTRRASRFTSRSPRSS
jgi:Mg2+-importing ATPase